MSLEAIPEVLGWAMQPDLGIGHLKMVQTGIICKAATDLKKNGAGVKIRFYYLEGFFNAPQIVVRAVDVLIGHANFRGNEEVIPCKQQIAVNGLLIDADSGFLIDFSSSKMFFIIK